MCKKFPPFVWIVFLLTVFVLGGVVWPAFDGKKVDVVTPVYAPAAQVVYATGTVEASRMIPIAPKTTARIAALLVDEGGIVTQGDVLARLEDSDLRNTLAELEAKLAKAQNDLTRAKTLAKAGALSKEGLDAAQTNFLAAQASVERVKAELGFLQLFAPESGTIIRRDGEVGEMASPTTPIFWMTGGNDLRIETEVDEEDIALVKPGQRVLIRADAFANQMFEGNVQNITPKGDPIARSYRVRIGMPAQSPLMIGMTAETNIITAEKDRALMIPRSALDGNNVMILEEGRVKSITVQTGLVTKEAVEITGGIDSTQPILRDFNLKLEDEKNLRPSLTSWSAVSSDNEDQGRP